MLISGKKISRIARQKKLNIRTLLLSQKKFQSEKKNITPSLQVKWSVPKYHIASISEISKNKEISERSTQKVTKSNSLGNFYQLA